VPDVEIRAAAFSRQIARILLAVEKLYWMVPPVLELSSIDLAYVYDARMKRFLLKRRRMVSDPAL